MQNVHTRFINETKNHTITIHRNDGLYRHVEFSNNGSSTYKFMLTTWPGYLSISGDMGCYVFQRIEDMFDFFHSDHVQPTANLGYWGEKLQAIEKNGGYKEFSYDGFIENLQQQLKDHAEYEDGFDQFGVWAELTEHMENCDHDHEEDCLTMAANFKSENGFEFSDVWHSSSKEYTFQYQWICWAIAYGVRWFEEATKK